MVNYGTSFGFTVVNNTLSNTQVVNNVALGFASNTSTASLKVDGGIEGVPPLGLSWLANVYLHSPPPTGNEFFKS